MYRKRILVQKVHLGYDHIRTIYLLISGVFTIVMGFWTSAVGMIICTCGFGFFHIAFDPIIAECAILVTGPKLFNFAYGYVLVMMGVGWTVGAPAAGRLFSACGNSSFSQIKFQFFLGMTNVM